MHTPGPSAPLALSLVLVYGAAACHREAPAERFAPAHRAAAPPGETARSARSEPSGSPDKANDLDPFTAAPLPGTRRTLAHILESSDRIGAYLGLPEGWINDDPSYTLFFPRGPEPKPPARAVAMTLGEPGLTAANREQLLTRGAEPASLREGVWETWKEGHVSPNRFEAVIARGTGKSVLASEGDRVAIAAVIAIEGAPAIGFVGSWAAASPEHEQAMLEMLRAMERCQVQVGRGCVSDRERNTDRF